MGEGPGVWMPPVCSLLCPQLGTCLEGQPGASGGTRLGRHADPRAGRQRQVSVEPRLSPGTRRHRTGRFQEPRAALAEPAWTCACGCRSQSLRLSHLLTGHPVRADCPAVGEGREQAVPPEGQGSGGPARRSLVANMRRHGLGLGLWVPGCTHRVCSWPGPRSSLMRPAPDAPPGWCRGREACSRGAGGPCVTQPWSEASPLGSGSGGATWKLAAGRPCRGATCEGGGRCVRWSGTPWPRPRDGDGFDSAVPSRQQRPQDAAVGRAARNHGRTRGMPAGRMRGPGKVARARPH